MASQSTHVSKLSSKPADLSAKVYKIALDAYHHVEEHGIAHKPILAIIDYSLSSKQKRLWIIDMKNHHLLFHTTVAHGKGSGMRAHHFSNGSGTHASSLGVFLTQGTYQGHKGVTLRLQGLEPGINNNALHRAIVMHGAWYMTPRFIRQHGRAGRSWGCPALPPLLASKIINTIKQGTVLVSYFPDKHWLQHSHYLA